MSSVVVKYQTGSIHKKKSKSAYCNILAVIDVVAIILNILNVGCIG